MAANIQSRIQVFQRCLEQLRSGLKSFQESGDTFKVLTTIDNKTFEPRSTTELKDGESARTLFILDSSFNPPSIAHQCLAERALHKSSSDAYPKPHRFLLLFSTMNADKAPSAAPFEQRLTLMTIFASDLLRSIASQSADFSLPPIDVGVTIAPYYTDKSLAISDTGLQWYPDSPKHIHLIGYDTLVRVFAAKYYKEFDPPFSALNPYFDAGHELRATLRPGDEYESIADQEAFLEKLRSGEMESQGGKADWAKQVHLISPNPQAGVSSTKIRNAAKDDDWTSVQELCTPMVSQWVKTQQLYEDDARGSKMG